MLHNYYFDYKKYKKFVETLDETIDGYGENFLNIAKLFNHKNCNQIKYMSFEDGSWDEMFRVDLLEFIEEENKYKEKTSYPFLITKRVGLL